MTNRAYRKRIYELVRRLALAVAPWANWSFQHHPRIRYFGTLMRPSMRDAVLQGKGALLVGSKRFAAWASVAHLAHPPTHNREVDGA